MYHRETVESESVWRRTNSYKGSLENSKKTFENFTRPMEKEIDEAENLILLGNFVSSSEL